MPRYAFVRYLVTLSRLVYIKLVRLVIALAMAMAIGVTARAGSLGHDTALPGTVMAVRRIVTTATMATLTTTLPIPSPAT